MLIDNDTENKSKKGAMTTNQQESKSDSNRHEEMQ